MKIEYYYKDGVLGCCPLQVYAIVRTQSFSALKDDGAGNKALEPYVAADNADFAIVTAEHAELSKLYYVEIDPSDLTLPATPDGEYYYLEFWLADVAGTYDRSVDTLLDTKEFIWDGSDYANDWMPSNEGEVELATSYDSVTHTSYFMASLSQNGQHVATPTSCSFKMVNENGEVIAESNPGTQLTNIPGVYYWNEPGQDPTADRVYAIIVTITYGGHDYSTVHYQVNWD